MDQSSEQLKQREAQLRSACLRVTTLSSQGDSLAAQTVLAQFPDLANVEECAIEIIYTEFQVLDELGRRPDLSQWLHAYQPHAPRLERLIKLHDLLDDQPQSEYAPSQTASSTPALLAPLSTDSQLPQISVSASPLGTIGNYELLEEIGRGGMGVVYRARQSGLSRQVAVKVLKSTDDPANSRARFLQEAQAVAALQHPHIVQIYEVGSDQGRDFLSMELIEGGSLESWMEGPPRSNHEIALLVKYLADAVGFAHRQGIIHRDLKPANVLLPGNGQLPKVVDFGLAKRLDDATGLQTQTGAVIGTPGYMSPEQAAGNASRVGPESDIFALGIILYQLLTRRLPFEGTSVFETLQQILECEPLVPSKLQASVPRDLETICLKCLSKGIESRYPSAQALAEDLVRFLDHRPILARRASWWERSCRAALRHREVAALVMAILALAIFGLSVFAWQRHTLAIAQRQADQQMQLVNLEKNRAAQAEAAYDASMQRTRELLGRTTALGMQLEFEPGYDQTRQKAFEEATAYYEEFLQKHAHDPTIRFEAAQAAVRSAKLHADLGMWTEAEDRLRRADAWLVAFRPTDPVQLDKAIWLRSECLLHSANVQRRLERWSQAEVTYDQLVSMLKERVRTDPRDTGALVRLANAQINLCFIYRTQKRWDESIPVFWEAIDNCLQASRIATDSIGQVDPSPPEDIQVRLAQRVTESSEFRSNLLRDRHDNGSRLLQSGALIELALALDDFAITLKAQGQIEAAEHAMRESLALRQAMLQVGENNRTFESAVARGMTDLAAHLNETGRPQEALPLLESAEQSLAALARDFPERVQFRSDWAYCLIYAARALNSQQKYGLAAQKSELAVQLREQLAAQNPGIESMRDDLAYCLTTWGANLAADGQLEKAKAVYDRVIDMKLNTPLACNNLAWQLSVQSSPTPEERQRAVQLAQRAVEVASDDRYYWNTYALALYRAGRFADGLAAIERAQELSGGGGLLDWYFHAMLLAGLGRTDEARSWFQRAELNRQNEPVVDEEIQQFAREAANVLAKP